MSIYCGNEKNCVELARMEKRVEQYEKEVYKAILAQDKRIADLSCKFNGNIQAAIAEYVRVMEEEGKLGDIITDTLLNDLYMMEKKTASIINAKEYGAIGNGICNDTEALQAAIDAANKAGRTLHIPAGRYLINAPLVLNGCSLVGEPGNIYEGNGTVIDCLTADFTAIKQGSTAAADIMFNISDIVVNGAAVGFEIVYAINSKFERLYATNCATGYKIGTPQAVGCMFCEFNNLYTVKCAVAVKVDSAQYFNNNRFNNGFLSGTDHAMEMKVTGGYGAVGNVFNNVEFQSAQGRGIVLTSCVNTVFNNCYMECGGNVIRMKNTCSITLNNCVYGSYKTGNKYGDANMVYAEGGGVLAVNNGVVFLTDNYKDRYFFGAANKDIYANITVVNSIKKNGTASGFAFFENRVNESAMKQEEQVITTGTVTVPAKSSVEVPFTYATPFSAIPNVTFATMRGEHKIAMGMSYAFSERLTTGGKITVSNDTDIDKSVSFSIYAKII